MGRRTTTSEYVFYYYYREIGLQGNQQTYTDKWPISGAEFRGGDFAGDFAGDFGEDFNEDYPGDCCADKISLYVA